MACYDQKKVQIIARRFESKGNKILLGVLVEKDHKQRTVLYDVNVAWILHEVGIINRIHGTSISLVDPLLLDDFLSREALPFFGDFRSGPIGFPVGVWLVYPDKGEPFRERLILDYSMGGGDLELDLFRGGPAPRISFAVPNEFRGRKDIALVITGASEKDLLYGQGCSNCGQIVLNIPESELRTRIKTIPFPEESGYFAFVPELGLVRADTAAERAEREARRPVLRYYFDAIPTVDFLTLRREAHCFIGLPLRVSRFHPSNPERGVLSTCADEFTKYPLLVQIPEQDVGKFPNLTLLEQTK